MASKANTEGAAEAHKLIEDMPLTDIELQGRLLNIRSNEYKLRNAGYTEAADEYINSFTNVITAESDSLASLIYDKATD